VIGYELRPIYHPFVYGVSDVMDITYDYRPQGKVVVSVELLFHVEQTTARRYEFDDHQLSTELLRKY
jgi:hypothetical protein